MDATPQADGDGPRVAAPRRGDSSWLTLFLGAIFVIAVAATFSIVMTRDDSTPPTPAFSLGVIDHFDRPASNDGLGGDWTQDAGGWAIEAGFALLREPVGRGDNLTIQDLGATGQTVNLKVGGFAQCGVVVRYQDPFNYVAMVRAAPFAVWNVIEMVDGKESTVVKVPDEDGATVTITLTVTDNVLSASVGFGTVTLVRTTQVAGTRFGLIARGDDVAGCTWDDVTAQKAN